MSLGLEPCDIIDVLVLPAHNAILTIPLSPTLATQLWQIKCSPLNEHGCYVLISTAHNAVLTFPLFPTPTFCTAAGGPVAVALLLPHQPLRRQAAPGGLRVHEGKLQRWSDRSRSAIACLLHEKHCSQSTVTAAHVHSDVHGYRVHVGKCVCWDSRSPSAIASLPHPQ